MSLRSLSGMPNAGTDASSNHFHFAMHRCLLLIIGVQLLICAACRNQPQKVETTLYFGLSRPDGGVVTDSSWQRFEQEEVIRVFPKGFTVIPAGGIWKSRSGMVSEHTMVVVSLNLMETALSKRIDSLRERYKMTFGQESVMRVDKIVARWDF